MTRERHATISQQGRLWATALIAIAIDQLTKWRIEASLPIGESIYPLLELSHIFRLVHVLNRGVAFGSLWGYGWISIIVAFGVAGYLLYMNFATPGDYRFFRMTLGLILGGALGNVIDRFRLGHVTDFIHFNFRPLLAGFPPLDLAIFDIAVFNWADVFIFSGVGCLAYLMITNRLPDEFEREQQSEAAAPSPSTAKLTFAPYQAVIRAPQAASGDPDHWRIARFGLRAFSALAVGGILWFISLNLSRRRRQRHRRRGGAER